MQEGGVEAVGGRHAPLAQRQAPGPSTRPAASQARPQGLRECPGPGRPSQALRPPIEGSKEELEERKAYLNQQRDKLLNMKREARIKALADAEAKGPLPPSRGQPDGGSEGEGWCRGEWAPEDGEGGGVGAGLAEGVGQAAQARPRAPRGPQSPRRQAQGRAHVIPIPIRPHSFSLTS